MASLRFNFDGDRRTGKRQNPGRMRPLLFSYPRYIIPGVYPGIYPLQRKTPIQEKDTDTTQPQPETYESQETQIVPDNENISDKQNIIDIKKDTEPEKNGYESVNTQLPVGEKIYLPDNIATPPGKDNKVSVNEKFISLLNTSEAGLNNLKNQVRSSRLIFEEMMFKLDSFTKVMDIVYSNEERKIKGPQATVASQKVSKDVIDEILELLQTPAFQSMVRQFVLNLMSKNNITNKPEN